jgi:hypothetical protein
MMADVLKGGVTSQGIRVTWLNPNELHLLCLVCGDDAQVKRRDRLTINDLDALEAIDTWGHGCRTTITINGGIKQ